MKLRIARKVAKKGTSSSNRMGTHRRSSRRIAKSILRYVRRGVVLP